MRSGTWKAASQPAPAAPSTDGSDSSGAPASESTRAMTAATPR
ncbi:hypothetical protein [Actinoalloteichus caeruleus]|uniref:Uncharacterized protein n=1 Tax=Actinoalloteichus caeruleus DSM 43889 TaxID=1120930 RepID=A0ABT1JLX2_ACTCY|nr:hypothetical protein [Actinoalloteichus caeruleus]MCP2333520.1 hypothetical protein [Actinoalloteichus caeruleus DSM 43889]